MHIRPLKNFDRVLETAPDKSITHRAVMFNAFARGEATVTNALLGGDCKSTIACMRALGAEITVDGSTVKVKGATVFKDATLDAGNSGTTTRLLTGLLAGKNVTATLDGDDSLRTRPMKRVTEPLSAMGAIVTTTDGKVPLTVRPAVLHGIDYVMPMASAQVKSAVILAGINADGVTRVTEPALSRNHTELMLKAMGADIAQDGLTVTVRRSEPKAVDVRVPGDISSAAFLLGAAVVTGGSVTVINVGLNPTRTGIVEVLRAMGAKITIDNYSDEVEPIGDLTVKSAPLRPFKITKEIVPSLIDELPLLAAIACYANGTSVISGAEELKVKESDRIATTVEALTALGADVEPTEDGMIIHGHGGLKGGGTTNARGDHRIAMTSAVAALGSELGCDIDGAETASISYPGFWEVIC
ncbi:MAG: 3-phosphoshikimate 1-carboxyvinyltransferase [Clostridia bacterium]|nr:3-phosphoshikimate 1-carboxyvinyltransferase [Clostridia bacterium]